MTSGLTEGSCEGKAVVRQARAKPRRSGSRTFGQVAVLPGSRGDSIDRRRRGAGSAGWAAKSGGPVRSVKEGTMSSTTKRVTATVLLTLSLMASAGSMASAAPRDKCANDPENFQIVNGQCVSDGRAEKLRP